MPQLLFIPGIKGTELFENDRKVWFPKSSGDITSLSIENQLQYGNPLRVVNAYGLKKFEVYKGVMDEFGPDEIEFFTYDWRQDIRNHVARLVQKIIELTPEDEQINIVAHSMGGMIAKLAILELVQLNMLDKVKKLITLGTPWHGSADAFKAISFGEPGIYLSMFQLHQFLNDKDTRWLARQFPATYQLLPSETYYQHDEGKYITIDREDPLLYIEVLQRIQQEYNKTEGDAMDIFNILMRPIQEAMLKPLPEGFKHDCLIGCTFPTIYQIPENLPSMERLYFKKDVIFKNGDGVVPIFSAKPSHRASIFYISAQHSDMASKQGVLEFIRWSLLDNPPESKPAALLEEIDDKLNSGVMARIKCPIDTTILDDEGRYLAGQFDPSIEEISPLLESESVMYFGVGESKYVYFPESIEEELTVKVDSYETGIADISIEYLNSGSPKEVKFDPLPVEKGQGATIKIPMVRETISTAALQRNSGEILNKIIRDKPIVNTTQLHQRALAKLKLSFQKAEGTEKSHHLPVYSGDVIITITARQEELENVYYSVDNEAPILYTEESRLLSFNPGKHVITAFGKDGIGRPLKPVQMPITIDSILPVTKLIASVKPDVLELNFEGITLGTRHTTYFRVKGSKNEIWNEVDVTEQPVFVDWGKLDIDNQASMEIEYYSKNEFGSEEAPKTIKISLGNIPSLMWNDNPAFVTPETIWHNLFRNSLLGIDQFLPSFISKNIYSAGFNDRTPDDAKGIRFSTELLQIDVMYAEKYSLYFKKPPTEVLEVGQKCTFTFELLTERTKDRITHTSPRARLRPIRANNVPDTQLELVEKDGEFSGEFTVGQLFLQYKYKLVIVDSKNTHPALREVSLIMKEEDEE